MSKRISIAVIDDHPLVRAGVIKTLGFDQEFDVVGEGASAADAIHLARTSAPDVILLDISMPGSGIEAAREISKLPSPPKIVMLTVSEDDDTVLLAIDAGASGYITKGLDSLNLISAIRSIASGSSYVSPDLSLRLINRLRDDEVPNILSSLTKQEKSALALVAEGLSNREVAEKLGLVESSVKGLMTRIMVKLNVRNRVEAALWARQNLERKR